MRKNLMIVSGVVGALVLAIILMAPMAQRAMFYPAAKGMPLVVSENMDELLRRLEAVLQTKASVIAEELQPGLSESQIAALESKGGFRLNEELRALYRWRNGQSTNSNLGLLPGQRFLPLEEVVESRLMAEQHSQSASPAQRVAFSIFAGHRRDWVGVLDDGAGDGYFYDPQRTDAQGAFFYHLAEMGYYVWFPSVRNFLTGVIECYESGAVRPSAEGKDLEEDFVEIEKIWSRYGGANQR